MRDNPPATEADHPYTQVRGQRQDYNAGRPEVHEVLRRWRAIADSYDPPRVLVGETYVLEPELLASFYGAGDEVNLAFNLMFLHAKFDPAEIRGTVEAAERLIPTGSQPTWAAGSHDNRRFATRWCGDDPQKTRAAMVMLLTLRGTPFLYYGDELGMPETNIPADRVLDPVGKIHGPASAATANARRCSGPTRPAPASRARVSSPGSRSATLRRATSSNNATIRIRCSR